MLKDLVAILLLGAPLTVMAADSAGFNLSFHPVGTPEFMGLTKIGQPGFIPPIAEVVYAPQQVKCLVGGEYEAMIEADGSVSSIRSHHAPVDGDACEKRYLFPYIMKWHFKPAMYEGKPTPVYMWFGLSP